VFAPSDLPPIAQFITTLIAVTTGTVALVRNGGLLAQGGEHDPKVQFLGFGLVWRYAVIFGAAFLMLRGLAVPVAFFLGTETWLTYDRYSVLGLIAAGLLTLPTICFWGPMRRKANLRWGGYASAAMVLCAVFLPSLVIPAAVRDRREREQAERATTYMMTTPMAKMVNARIRRQEFVLRYPKAQFCPEESASFAGHQRYKENGTAFDFLDDRLISLSNREPSSESSLRRLVAQYTKHLGPYTTTAKSPGLAGQRIMQVFAWRLDNSDLYVRISELGVTNAAAEISVEVGRISESEILVSRTSENGDR
jgi:hypothetical protein